MQVHFCGNGKVGPVYIPRAFFFFFLFVANGVSAENPYFLNVRVV